MDQGLNNGTIWSHEIANLWKPVYTEGIVKEHARPPGKASPEICAK